MQWLPNRETRAAVLKDPLFRAGLVVVTLLGVTAVGLVVADTIRSTGRPGITAVHGAPAQTATAGPTGTSTAASGVAGITRTTTAVRTAPGTSTPILGTLPIKTAVQIDGRTTNALWMRVVFPPKNGEGLHGWIDVANLDIVGDPASLVVATPDPPLAFSLPTEPSGAPRSAAATPRPSGTRTATPTPTGILPDLVIGAAPALTGGKLFVTVLNQGKGDMHGDLVVAVFNHDGTKLLGGATLSKFTLAAGGRVAIDTGYIVAVDQSLVLVVDPGGNIAEANHANNRTTISFSIGNASPTPLPAQATPAPTRVATATANANKAVATPTMDIPATLIAIATKTARAAH